MKSVLDWDAKTPRLYDHRWINLHGIRAYAESLGVRDPDGQPLSLPEEQWEEIEHRTRQEYRRGFEEALDRLRARGSASN